MASRQTDKYGNPVHHTAATGQGVPLGAPGTTGAVETHDPLGAPGSTGASPTTGYGAGAGGQEQLHRPGGGVGGGTTGAHGTTAQGYAYGTAPSMGHAGHAGVAVPHTTGVTSGYDTRAHRTGGTGQGTHGLSGAHAGYDTGAHKSTDIGYTGGVGGGHVGGYDTGSLGGGTDIGHTGGVGQRTHERGQFGGYDTGAGDKTTSHELGGEKGGYDTGGGRAHGQGLGGGDWARSRGVKDQHGSDKTHGSGGYDTGGNKTHEQGMEGHGGGYESLPSAADPLRGGVSATVVEVVTEEPIREEEGKGIIDKIMEHLPGSGGGGTK